MNNRSGFFVLRLMSGEAAAMVVQMALAEGAPERLSEGAPHARYSESRLDGTGVVTAGPLTIPFSRKPQYATSLRQVDRAAANFRLARQPQSLLVLAISVVFTPATMSP